jgi:hypothetical protein
LATLRQLHATPALLTAVASTTGSELAVQRTLRSTWNADLVRAALSLHEARERAGGILPNTEQLWLTGTALEQCTHPIVAEHKAARYPTVFQFSIFAAASAATPRRWHDAGR